MKLRPSGHKLLHSVIAESAADTPTKKLFLSHNSNYTCSSGVFYI